MKIEDMHKQAAEEALKKAGGNRTRAAEMLGVSVRTVRNWIRRYALDSKFPSQRGRQK